MYFPWIGLFDLLRQSNIFVHYDDVQLSRGFYNRVQIKTTNGTKMLSVPIRNKKRNQLINESVISYEVDWVSEHRNYIVNSYRKTKHIDDALDIFDSVNQSQYQFLNQLTRASIIEISKYLELDLDVLFFDSPNLSVSGKSSERLMRITKKLEGDVYLTGHGALQYLNHDIFEENNIEVKYIDYQFESYNQMYGQFTPYVTILDAIAHLGKNAKHILKSKTENWRKAIERPEKLRPRI